MGIFKVERLKGRKLLGLLITLLVFQACGGKDAVTIVSHTSPDQSEQVTAANSHNLTVAPTSSLINETKVDTVLLDLLVQYRLNGKEGALKYARERGIIDNGNNIIFTLVLSTEDSNLIRTKIQSLGGIIKSTYKNLVSVAVPLDVITNYTASSNFFQNLSSLSTVQEIRFLPPFAPSDVAP